MVFYYTWGARTFMIMFEDTHLYCFTCRRMSLSCKKKSSLLHSLLQSWELTLGAILGGISHLLLDVAPTLSSNSSIQHTQLSHHDVWACPNSCLDCSVPEEKIEILVSLLHHFTEMLDAILNCTSNMVFPSQLQLFLLYNRLQSSRSLSTTTIYMPLWTHIEHQDTRAFHFQNWKVKKWHKQGATHILEHSKARESGSFKTQSQLRYQQWARWKKIMNTGLQENLPLFQNVEYLIHIKPLLLSQCLICSILQRYSTFHILGTTLVHLVACRSLHQNQSSNQERSTRTTQKKGRDIMHSSGISCSDCLSSVIWGSGVDIYRQISMSGV